MRELRNPADAARADSWRTSERLADSIDLLVCTVPSRQHQRVARVLARQHAGDLEAVRRSAGMSLLL